MKAQKILVLLIAVAGLVVACGTQSTETLFVDGNAWKGAIPTDATIISPEEFRKGVESGELKITSPASVEAQKAATQKQFEADKNFLAGLSNKTPEIQALLDEAAKQTNVDDERTVVGPNNEPVVVFGLATQLRNAAEVYQRSQSTDNALEDYALSYSLLTDAQKSNLPTPESLKGKTLAEIQAALTQINQVLATTPTLLNTARLEPGVGVAPSASADKIHTQAVVAGNGRDNDGACTPTNYVSRYWFPLKNFVSPIKQQAKRGTCWAFAAIGAIESRERVQNNNPADLSEQFLVNKVKEDWDSDKYSDGYWSEKALDLAVNKGQVLPSESAWTYNPAYGRPNVQDNSDSYANTCGPTTNWGGYSGTCSDTAHESRRTCSTFVFTVCSYVTVTYGGPGIASSHAIQVWKNGDGFDLNRYRNLLAQGHVLIASFPVYRGFMDDVTKTGVVSNYAQTKLDKGKEVAGSYGGHAVQVVGFLANDELTTYGNPVNIGGGGYFIIKNSWGCAADGGYYYIPADYISKFFTSLSTLNFDGRRSDAWNKEQASPGGSQPINIKINSGLLNADLRVEKEISAAFLISHAVAKSVNLSVSSNLDGQLYNGPWNTDTNVLFGPSLKKTFASVGTRSISLVASYGGNSVSASFSINVTNTPPKIQLQYTGDPQQGEEYAMAAQILDINETGTLCANTYWEVDAPDTLNAITGCQVKIKFGKTGSRQVRVLTQDTEGATAATSVNLNVLPPPINPYPRITSASVYSREFGGTGRFRFCDSLAVASGNTIDLREMGCSFLISQPQPQRYFADVVVENPSNETLTYDWNLYVKPPTEKEYSLYTGNTKTFDLSAWGNYALSTNDCRITLKVNAPEASRSKSLTAWSGKCTYYAGSLR